MVNSSHVSYFTLGAYVDTGPLRWLYFVILLSVYFLIVLSNLLLITIICLNRTLHEPMYIFLCSLFMNELYGSTALFPLLLYQIPVDVHTVLPSFCFVQIFCIYSYVSIEFLTLAIMSYDRFQSICFPLHYSAHMNFTRVFLLVAFSWSYPCISILLLIILSIPLKLCDNVIPKVYCDNYFIVKMACSDTKLNNIYGLIITTVIVLGPLGVIFFTYLRILKVCFRGSKQTQQKALSTCAPHLASIVNFSFGVCFEVLQSRFDLKSVHKVLKVVLSLYFLAVQPLFNPLMYGLKLPKIRVLCRNLLHSALSHR
ncbi:olfactory receptor 11A1-like [Boleophthalmus pectinirostris]|uniref:olfactory receptor 11A1-like n=1 Tax=Boleophthalmus pectinirostris TaxID=150288 RepID=UPI000A1C3D41|nr:olfactory receptor 11A1-like [Boleophthalmus pectinirostris]